MIEEKKTDLINLLKVTVNTILSRTDWAVIKCQELGLNLQEHYPEICNFRNTIRNKNQEIEQMIAQATSLEELQEIEQLIVNLDQT